MPYLPRLATTIAKGSGPNEWEPFIALSGLPHFLISSPPFILSPTPLLLPSTRPTFRPPYRAGVMRLSIHVWLILPVLMEHPHIHTCYSIVVRVTNAHQCPVNLGIRTRPSRGDWIPMLDASCQKITHWSVLEVTQWVNYGYLIEAIEASF